MESCEGIVRQKVACTDGKGADQAVPSQRGVGEAASRGNGAKG